MRLDYKSIIVKHYVLHLSGAEIASQLNASKSGVNGFLKAFKDFKLKNWSFYFVLCSACTIFA